MNTDTIVKTDKKLVFKFLAFLLGYFILGAICGGSIAILEDNNLIPSNEFFAKPISSITPVLFIAFNVIFLVLSLVSYFKSKHQYNHWDGGDESVIDTIEHQLNYPMVFCNIATIFNLVFYAVIVYFIENNYYHGSMKTIIERSVPVVFLLGLAWTVIINNCTVNLVKRMNPEKQGSVFDRNFQKQWEDSCDEGQKLIIYKSAYAAFKWVNLTCITLWVIGFVGIFSFHTGILPVIFTCIIYFVSNMAFMVTSIKLEK